MTSPNSLQAIRERVRAAEPLSFEDGVALYHHPNLLEVGALVEQDYRAGAHHRLEDPGPLARVEDVRGARKSSRSSSGSERSTNGGAPRSRIVKRRP